MSTWQVVVCPHCGNNVSLEIDTRRFQFREVHLQRKSFDELHGREVERDYCCEECDQCFFVTFTRKRRSFEYGMGFFKFRKEEDETEQEKTKL